MRDRCILILSCDTYSDLWKPFFIQFWKHWPDCPYPIYLGSNTVSYTGNRKVKTILSGKDIDWSTSLMSILKQIPEKSLLLMLDDMFICNRVSNKVIEDCFEFLARKNTRHIHFHPKPTSDTIAERGTFGVYKKGAPYRVNTVGFWKKQSLVTLLLPGESSWIFEIQGSYRSSYEEGFYCPQKQVFDYIHVVEKGKILFNAFRYCKDHDIPLPKIRDVSSFDAMVESNVRAWYFNVVLNIPWKLRVGVMSRLRKLLISY